MLYKPRAVRGRHIDARAHTSGWVGGFVLRGSKRLVLVAAGATTLLLVGCSSSGGGAGKTVATPSAVAVKPSASAKPVTVSSRPSAGCQATAIAPAGQATLNLSAGGAQGTYIRHLPPSYDGRKPLPLIVDLHGYSEAASIHVAISGLGSYGDVHHFITVTPQTAGPVPRWSTALDSADVAFIGGLMDKAEQTLCIDEARIFVAGYSNGAFMTSAVACKYASRIAAVAPVAGIREIDGCTFSRPVPVVAFHGTADTFVPYDGSFGSSALKLPAADGSGKTLGELGANTKTKGPSIPEATAAWAKRNGCGSTPSSRGVTSDVTLISYPCPANAEVELYRVTKGGHAWPGSKVGKSLESVVGRVTMSISADDIMWTFFQQHPLAP
jgi:polyhydroxybutyrate depolymerase